MKLSLTEAMAQATQGPLLALGSCEGYLGMSYANGRFKDDSDDAGEQEVKIIIHCFNNLPRLLAAVKTEKETAYKLSYTNNKDARENWLQADNELTAAVEAADALEL